MKRDTTKTKDVDDDAYKDYALWEIMKQEGR
jgi:hypothetical protein